MELYKHQLELLARNPKKWLLAHDCGTGKTLLSIELVKKNSTDCLVICPKSIKTQWLEELKKNSCSPLKWLVMTKEEFKKAVKLKAVSGYQALICDESHYFSGMQSFKKKSGMLKALLEYIKWANPKCIYLLTGTPYLSSPYNIYAYAEILGVKWNYLEFKQHFFSMVNFGRRWPVPVVKKGMEKDIAKLVNQLGNTVRMDECVDLPEQIFQTENFELTTEQRAAIKELTDTNPLAYWTHVHQICGATLKSDGYTKDKFFKSEKLNRLLELCEQHKKLVIVCRYNNEIQYIKEQILHQNKDKQTFVINGDTKNKHDIVKLANELGEAILLVNAACSEGWEIPSFPMMIFYSYDFSLKNYLQMIARIQRINNIKTNVYKSLIIKDKEIKIDEEVYKCIMAKKDFDVAIYGRDI